MAGYTRQSVADIIANAVIKAAPVNAEFNAIRDAFNNSTGHKHDGTSAEGTYVPLIADLDGLNKVVVDTTNNRVGFFSEVSGAAVEQVRIQDGAIVPVTTDDVDLGTSSLKFKNLYVNGIGEIGSVTILGGTIDNTVIGGTTPAAADFTTMDASGNVTVGGTFAVTGTSDLTGTTTITSADINSGAMDNTVIGNTTPVAITGTTITGTSLVGPLTGNVTGNVIGNVTGDVTGDLTGNVTGNVTGNLDGIIGSSSPAAGSFTTVSTSGQATLATVDINGGSIDGTTIGASTPAAITGTTITGTSLVGPVTGDITGNVTGNVTGNLTGNVTGNVTAASGTSSFTDVTINGTLNMNAGTTATITNLTAPSNDLDAATKKYVDDEVAGLVDSAPGTLVTLNELAAALGDDADFSNTVTTSIATKLPLAGGTMTGAIAMGTSKITGLGDPTAAQDAASKNYADTTFLGLSGGTMTGAIDMGSSKVTTTYTPTNGPDLTNKTYVDSIVGSGASAAASAAAAATSATNAATSETNAGNSATAAATSATNAANSYDDFDDRYLGAKSSAPALDNDGDALIAGALYFNTTTDIMYVYGSSGWQAAGSSVNGTSERQTYTATSGQTTFAVTYDPGYVDVYLNGVKLISGTDFTATSGTSIVLTTGATAGDSVDIVAYGTFVVADTYTKSQADARYVEVAGDTMTGNLAYGDNVKATFGASADLQIYHDGSSSLIQDLGTGILQITSNGSQIKLAGNGSTSASFYTNGECQLFCTGDLKLATKTNGINVTGNVALSGAVDFGNWTITETGGSLYFATGGTNKMKLDASGNLDVVGNVNSNATIT